MEKKISKGVRMFAILIIASSLLFSASTIQRQPMRFNSIIFIMPYFVLSMISGIFLLFRKDWARILTILFLSMPFFSIISLLLHSLITSHGHILSTVHAIYSGSLEGMTTSIQKGASESGCSASFFGFLSISILIICIFFNLGAIYFFTRPKVKEQFK